MKTKSILAFILITLFSTIGEVMAYDFIYSYKGKTLYYDKNYWDNTAIVTYCHYDQHFTCSYADYVNGDVVIPSEIVIGGIVYTVSSINHDAFNGCRSLTSIEIPSTITSIGGGAFAGCSSLASVKIPSSITSIGSCAFAYCNSLTSIEIPDSVTSLGGVVFYGCNSLASIIVGSGNTVYDSRNNCNAIIETSTNKLLTGCKNTIIPSSVTSIGEKAFWDCSGLSSIEIPNSITSIGSCAFAYCNSLTSIEIPSSVTDIGVNVLEGCTSIESIVVQFDNTKYDSRNNCNAIIETSTNKLLTGCKNTIIPSSITSIGENAFWGCSGLSSMEIPNSVTNIGAYAFYECSSLTSIEMGSSVTTIDRGAFSRCSGLTSIMISASVVSIGDRAFEFCDNLNTIYSKSIYPPNVGDITFYYVPRDVNLFVPIGSVEAYKEAEVWKNFFNIYEYGTILFPNPVEEEVTLILSDADLGTTNLTIYNLQGKVIKTFEIKESEKSIKLDVSSLQKGTYTIMISNDKTKVTKKLIKR